MRRKPRRWRAVRHSIAGTVIFARNREGVADDGLGDEPVRSRRETAADAEIDIELAELEVRDREQRVLLLPQRQEMPDLSELAVVFEADEEILAQLAGEPGRRRKLGLALVAQSYVDDGIYDELPIRIANPDDRPHLDAVGQELTAAIDGKRRIKPKLPPLGDAVGQFRSAVETVIRDQSARKLRSGAALQNVIEMLLEGPLADLGDLGVVDLDFVRGQSCPGVRCGNRDGCKQDSTEDLLVHGDGSCGAMRARGSKAGQRRDLPTTSFSHGRAPMGVAVSHQCEKFEELPDDPGAGPRVEWRQSWRRTPSPSRENRLHPSRGNRRPRARPGGNPPRGPSRDERRGRNSPSATTTSGISGPACAITPSTAISASARRPMAWCRRT